MTWGIVKVASPIGREIYINGNYESPKGKSPRSFTVEFDAKGQAISLEEKPAAPKSKFATAEEAVKLSLEWEVTVTKQISGLVDLAISENDHITRNFLQWFVNEQLEEVASMEQLLSIVRRAGEPGLLFVEEYLARRGGISVASAGGGAAAE